MKLSIYSGIAYTETYAVERAYVKCFEMTMDVMIWSAGDA